VSVTAVVAVLTVAFTAPVAVSTTVGSAGSEPPPDWVPPGVGAGDVVVGDVLVEDVSVEVGLLEGGLLARPSFVGVVLGAPPDGTVVSTPLSKPGVVSRGPGALTPVARMMRVTEARGRADSAGVPSDCRSPWRR
jgi:hypothetical protein